MARFLETITAFENDVLVPIDRIKCVHVTSTNNNSWKIVIKGDDGEWEEFFKDTERLDVRYKEIKDILEAE